MNKFVTYESPDMFGYSISRPIMNKMGGVYMTPDDIDRLHTSEDVVTHTYGYTNKPLSTDKKKIPNPLTKITDPANPDGTTVSNIIMLPYRDVYTAYRKRGAIDSQWRVKLINSETGDSYGDYWYDLPISSEANLDVPSINEWTRSDATGNVYAPTDNQGNERGQAKVGVDPRYGGMYERSSQQTNKQMGVTKHGYYGNIPYTLESISFNK